MKPRRWLLFVCLALLAAGAGLHQGVRHLERGRHLENILVGAVSPAIGGSFTVGRVRLGFLCAYLRDVSVAIPANAFTVRITDIKIGLSLFKLVSTRGDLGRSIDKIILMNPRLTVSLRAPAMPASGAAPLPASSFSPGDFPVKLLFVKNGVVAVAQDSAQDIVVGEGINGKVWEGGDGVEFELKGRLASRSRNLSLSGGVFDSGRHSRISLRVTGARIGKSLRFETFTVAAGTLEGTGEFDITAAPGTAVMLRSTGWLQVRGAKVDFPAVSQSVGDIDCRLSMDGTRWNMDSLSARWNGVALGARGSWDITGTDTSTISVSGHDIDLNALMPGTPPAVSSLLAGNVWASVGLVKPGGTGTTLHGRIVAGGMQVLGSPVTTLLAAGSVNPDSGWRVRIDSLLLKTRVFQATASGILTPGDPAPFYKGSYEFRLDSFPSGIRGIQGALSGRGHAEGSGGKANADADVTVHGLRVAGVLLGEQRLGVVLRPDRLDFWSSGTGVAGIVAAGSIDSLSSGAGPRLEGTVSAGSDAIKLFLAQAGLDTAAIDSLGVEGVITGKLPAWTLQGSVHASVPQAHGSLIYSLAPVDSTATALRWEIADHRLLVGDTAFAFHGTGRIHDDSLVIDSVRCMGGLFGSGRVALSGGKAADIHLRYNHIALASAARWFAQGAGALQSGTLSGSTRISGPLENLLTSSDMHVRNLAVGTLAGLETDAVLITDARGVTILPLVVRKSGRIMVWCDTVRWHEGRLHAQGRFDDLDIGSIASEQLENEHDITGLATGTFHTSDSGFPVRVTARCARLGIDTFTVDSLELAAEVDTVGLRVTQLDGRDGIRSTISATSFIPWSFLGDDVGERDTLRAQVNVKGDLLATLEKNLYSPIAGTGMGEISLSFTGTSEGWHVGRSYARIPHGTLSLYPFVLQKITNFSFEMTVDDSSRVTTALSGQIKKKPVFIRSTHTIPRGYEPIVIGPLDFGALLATTPKRGIEIHLPGFQEIKDPLDVEFSRKAPWPEFAVSGPFDRLRLTGLWTLHSGQFTFPLMDTREIPWPFDPFPYISWELDLRPGSQNVMYFWDLQGKRRKLIRFVEAYLDPTSLFQVRGCDKDHTFRLAGNLHSYRGTIFFGRAFDRRFDVGLDFVPQTAGPGKGYDNLPVIWGSAEAYSDSSRFETIKLTLQLTDPVSKGVSQKGRIAMIPRIEKKSGSRPGVLDSIPNFVFHLSSDFDQTTGDAQREFFQETGMRFSSVEGAGEMVGNFGEQYLNRYFLQKLERTVARRLGLDVITIETSIASNYFNTFYNRKFTGLSSQWEQLALANLGVTVGRYFFRDNIFVKARGELIPQEQLLIPEYSVGLEVQPMRYLLMDFNYGILQGEKTIEHNPQVNLQLRLPITRVRNLLHF